NDGRGAPPQPSCASESGQFGVAVARVSPIARRVGRLLAPRPDPAVVLVPRGRGAAVLAGEPPAPRGAALGVDSARGLAVRCARVPGVLPRLGGRASDQLPLRGHAFADGAGIPAALPSGPWPAEGAVDRARGDPGGLLGAICALPAPRKRLRLQGR